VLRQTLKDLLSLRPIFRWTERPVRGHMALCVLAATIEAVMAEKLVRAEVLDPDLPFQSMTPRRRPFIVESGPVTAHLCR
jgi:hypothetical protein